MTPKSKPKAMLSPFAFGDLRKLAGNVRRSMIVAIDGLESNPRPSNSKQLTIDDEEREIRRLRLGKWRIIYLVLDDRPIILGIGKRPPYDYSDLSYLIENVKGQIE
jgi:mRNA-degrading endonuclease RelE of RelBE toxin-antitoxin system